MLSAVAVAVLGQSGYEPVEEKGGRESLKCFKSLGRCRYEMTVDVGVVWVNF